MKTITIHVAEDTYRAFQESASRSNRSAAELIREAMDEYHRNHLHGGGSVFDQAPADAGAVLHDLSRDDDLLGEMIE